MTGGDRDFHGNGPFVTFTAGLSEGIDPSDPTGGFGRPTSLAAWTHFTADETRSNWSQARASTERHLVTAPRCWEVTRLDSVSQFYWDYTDTNHARDIWGFQTGLVRKLDIRGDTSNDDIGRCTSDDTKYTVYYNQARYGLGYIEVPACMKDDGNLPDETVVPAQTLHAALQLAAQTVSMRLHNVDLSSFSPRFLSGANSFFEFLGTKDSFVVLPFSSGRYVFYIDDVNSVSAAIVPDGGGWLVTVTFESQGVEIRSSCNDMLITPGGEFIDPATLTHEDIVEGLQSNFFQWILCSWGGEITFDLGMITAGVRIFPDVDPAGGIRLRPAHPIHPERDIFLDLHVLGQTGPCHENVLAIADDCMEVDELSLELQTMLSSSLAVAVTNMLASPGQGVFGKMFRQLTTGLGLPTSGVVSTYVDTEGSLVYLTK